MGYTKTKSSTRIPRCVINRPAKRTSVWAATLYQDDLEYLKQHDIPISQALRAALTDYVLNLKSKERGRPAVQEKTKAERDAWILSARDDFKPDRVRGPAAAVLEIPRRPVPDMTGWTKADRDAWILSEGNVIPDRVMMAKEKTGAHV